MLERETCTLTDRAGRRIRIHVRARRAADLDRLDRVDRHLLEAHRARDDVLEDVDGFGLGLVLRREVQPAERLEVRATRRGQLRFPRVEIDRDRAAKLGVDSSDIATALRLMVGGEQKVSRYRDPAMNEDYYVQLRLSDGTRCVDRDLCDLKRLRQFELLAGRLARILNALLRLLLLVVRRVLSERLPCADRLS